MTMNLNIAYYACHAAEMILIFNFVSISNNLHSFQTTVDSVGIAYSNSLRISEKYALLKKKKKERKKESI